MAPDPKLVEALGWEFCRRGVYSNVHAAGLSACPRCRADADAWLADHRLVQLPEEPIGWPADPTWWLTGLASILAGHHQGDAARVRVYATAIADGLEQRGHATKYLRRIIDGDLGATIYPAAQPEPTTRDAPNPEDTDGGEHDDG